jgi:hypothetical protein
VTAVHLLRPRSFFGGLFSLFPVAALMAASWDGTWSGGWENGEGIQIVIAGDKVTRVYRDGDYPEILSSEISPDRGMLVVWWVGGDGFLQRVNDGEATISLRERGTPARAFTVHRE